MTPAERYSIEGVKVVIIEWWSITKRMQAPFSVLTHNIVPFFSWVDMHLPNSVVTTGSCEVTLPAIKQTVMSRYWKFQLFAIHNKKILKIVHFLIAKFNSKKTIGCVWCLPCLKQGVCVFRCNWILAKIRFFQWHRYWWYYIHRE